MAETTVKMVAVAEIKPSPLNPRKHFDPAALRELADSIAGVGVLQPIVARPKGKGHEIVFGERRWRAAALAGIATVPVLERDMTDEEVLRVQLIENKHRADTTALEEGRGYRQLMKFDPKKYTAASIAEMVGVSEKYVWDRMKLTDLVPAAQEILDQGRMTAAHAILIARLKPKQQERVIGPGANALFEPTEAKPTEPSLSLGEAPPANGKEVKGEAHRLDRFKARSVRELDHWIAENIRFDPAQAAEAAPLLFAPTKAAVDAALAKPGRRKKIVQITLDYMATQAIRNDGTEERVYGRESWKRSGSETACPSTALGVIVAGAKGYGRSLHVCVNRDCETHWKAEVARRRRERTRNAVGGAGTGSRPAGAGGVSAAEQERRKAAEAKAEAEQKQWEALAPKLMQSVVASVKRASTSALVGYVAKHCMDRWTYGDAKRHLGMKGEPATVDEVLRVMVMERIGEEVEQDWIVDDVKSFCKAVGPFGGGIPAVVKELQARAAPKAVKKPAPKKAPGGKPAAKKKAAKKKRK